MWPHGEPPVVRAPATMPTRMARLVRRALAQVGMDEFASQEIQFDEDSRLGRELLYLGANDEWIRATREIVTLEAADSFDTRLRIHVDLGRISHEAFHNRTERLWLPLALLPPPSADAETDPAADHDRLAPLPAVRNAGGTILPSVPQAEARRWAAAALAEIIMNMAPVLVRDPQLFPNHLRREQRLLFSAALFRVLRDPDPDPAPLETDGFVANEVEAGYRETRIQQARSALLDFVHGIEVGSSALTEPGTGDRNVVLLQRAAQIVDALRAPSMLVVVGEDPQTTSAVFSVDVVGRPLARERRRRPYGPRARLNIDLLLPTTDAENTVIVDLPSGLSFAPGRTGSSVSGEIEVLQPPALADLEELSRQLSPAEPLSEPVARCLVDLTLNRMEAARDTYRHYASGVRTGEDTVMHDIGPDGMPAALATFRQALDRVRKLEFGPHHDVATAAAAAARAYRAAVGVTPGSRPVYRRTASSGTVSPHRAHVRLPAVENRSARATARRARVHLYLKADASAPLRAARLAAFLSVVLLGTLVLASRWLSTDSDHGDAQVLASVLTLFAAIQASRISSPDRSSLRGLIVSSGSWMVVLSVLPTVVLGILLAFQDVPEWTSVVALVVQTVLLVVMFLPALTGRPLRHDSEPTLTLRTGALLDYGRTDVVHAPWWRSTTAGALVLGANAHAYVIPQTGAGIGDLITGIDQLDPAPVVERGLARWRQEFRNRVETARSSLAARVESANGLTAVPDGEAPEELSDPDSTEHLAANILAMLRAGTANSSLTFMVFREEPAREQLGENIRPVYLDVDRLIVNETPISTVDVHLGFPADVFLPLAEHPVRTLLDVVMQLQMFLLDVQMPAPAPRGGDPTRRWARIRIGVRADEIVRVGDLLLGISTTVGPQLPGGFDLLVDMSTQTPPRRFLGTQHGATTVTIRPVDLDVTRAVTDELGREELDELDALDGWKYVADDDPGWVSLAAYDYVHTEVEEQLLQLFENEHPDVLLAGLTTARLHGAALVFMLGRHPAPDAPTVVRDPIPVDGQLLVDEHLATAQLGEFATDGVLLRVHTRYSDRPRLLSELTAELARGFGDITGTPRQASELQIVYLHTEVADGRIAESRFMVVLPDAEADQFTDEALERVEASARRVLTRAYAQATLADLGARQAAKAHVSIQLLTRPDRRPPQSPPAGVDVRDLDPRPARPEV